MFTQETLVHWMYGAFFATVGVLALLAENDRRTSLRLAWPGLVVVAAILLFLDPWLFHGYRGGVRGAAAEVENVQRWQLAGAMLLVGALELLAVRGKLPPKAAGLAWLVALPAAVLLHLHAQPGGGAELAVVLFQHRLMAIALLALGVSGVLAGFKPTPWLRVRNVAILILAGLLLAFTDVPGAHLGH